MNTYQIFWLDKFGDTDYNSIKTFQAMTPGKAKYRAFQYWESIFDCSFKDFLKGLQCKCIGRTKPSDYFSDKEQFERTIKYRGIPFAFQGMRVEQGGRKGFIAGGNSSANLNVLFDGWDHVSNCHPHWDIKYFDDKNNLVKEYKKS